MINFDVTPEEERRRLQIVVAVLCLVPFIAGAMGMIYGVKMTGETIPAMRIDSHIRYLSGLLFGIGAAYLISVPQIEKHGPRLRLLSAIVFFGGIARLAGIITVGWPGFAMMFGLIVEIVLVPALCIWQYRIEQIFNGRPPASSPDLTYPE